MLSTPPETDAILHDLFPMNGNGAEEPPRSSELMIGANVEGVLTAGALSGLVKNTLLIDSCNGAPIRADC
jgi:hypothetical protein